MKIKYFFLMTAWMLPSVIACRKTTAPAPEEIILGTKGFLMETRSSASAIDAMPASLNWGAAKASDGSAMYARQSGSVIDNGNNAYSIATGKYQTSTPTSYIWYVSNGEFTVGENTTMSVTNTVDYFAGKSDADDSTSPSIQMHHIFARTGKVTLKAPGGYTLSNVSATIVRAADGINGTAGTYSLTNKSFSNVTQLTSPLALGSPNTGSSSLVEGVETIALSTVADIYLIPASYQISVSYTIAKGDWNKTHTNTATVTLSGNKINHIVGELSNAGGATEILLSVSLEPWTEIEHETSFIDA